MDQIKDPYNFIKCPDLNRLEELQPKPSKSEVPLSNAASTSSVKVNVSSFRIVHDDTLLNPLIFLQYSSKYQTLVTAFKKRY